MRIAEHDCALCPRLVSYRDQNRAAFPDWHNGPVQSFGSLGSELLILGLAPGVRVPTRLVDHLLEILLEICFI